MGLYGNSLMEYMSNNFIEEGANKEEIISNVKELRSSIKSLIKGEYIKVSSTNEIMYKDKAKEGYIALVEININKLYKDKIKTVNNKVERDDKFINETRKEFKEELPKKILSIIKKKPEFKLFKSSLGFIGSVQGAKEYLCVKIKSNNING